MHHYLILLIALAAACTAPTRQPTPVDDWTERLRNGEDVFVEGQSITREIDLTRLLALHPTGPGSAGVKTGASLTFQNCRFLGRVSAFAEDPDGKRILATFLGNVSFIDCEFREEVSFRGSTILGLADFSRSRFFGDVNFEEASFRGHASFKDCRFYGKLRFQNAFFHQRISFMNAEFSRAVSFQQATFYGEAQFSVTRFQDYADFSLIHCQNDCFFNYSRFDDRCTFLSSYFAKRADFQAVSFAEATFKDSAFLGVTRFHESTVSRQLDFTRCFFLRGRPALSSFGEGTVLVEE